MGSRRVSLDNLDSAIRDILDEYQGDITNSMKIITAEITKKGAQAVKNESLSTFKPSDGKGLSKGRYGTGWTSQIETGRFSAQGTIYNSKYPGLPHLLENGHAKRGGGRVNGIPHIKPVEETITREFVQKVEASI